MDEKFEKRIISTYRYMFPSDEIMGDETKSCLFWGFECGTGWENLLENLFKEIDATHPPEDFKIAQIKSKFGSLRFYVDYDTQIIGDIISKYENLSYNTCEQCGASPAAPEGRWVTTLCEKCRSK